MSKIIDILENDEKVDRCDICGSPISKVQCYCMRYALTDEIKELTGKEDEVLIVSCIKCLAELQDRYSKTVVE